MKRRDRQFLAADAGEEEVLQTIELRMQATETVDG